MRNKLSLLIIVGLILSSCKKESVEGTDAELMKVETIEIYGVKYNKDSILNEISIVSGFSSSDIYFDSKSQLFKVKSLEFGEFSPEDYLGIKK